VSTPIPGRGVGVIQRYGRAVTDVTEGLTKYDGITADPRLSLAISSVDFEEVVW
jgi:hypothetical protein